MAFVHVIEVPSFKEKLFSKALLKWQARLLKFVSVK